MVGGRILGGEGKVGENVLVRRNSRCKGQKAREHGTMDPLS